MNAIQELKLMAFTIKNPKPEWIEFYGKNWFENWNDDGLIRDMFFDMKLENTSRNKIFLIEMLKTETENKRSERKIK